MQNRRIVLDTNCLLACISSKSENFRVWKGFQKGSFTLCVSNEILEEYQEIITSKTNSIVAENIINAIIESDFTEFVDPHYSLHLIQEDPDDNKFVDCAIAAGARYVVTNDRHYDVLRQTTFPYVDVISLADFAALL